MKGVNRPIVGATESLTDALSGPLGRTIDHLLAATVSGHVCYFGSELAIPEPWDME